MDRLANKFFHGLKIIGLIFILFLVACSNETEMIVEERDKDGLNDAQSNALDFVEEGTFVELELYAASSGTYLDHYPKIITIAHDGTVHLFTREVDPERSTLEIEIGDNPPSVEKKISLQEVEDIKQVLVQNRFASLPKDVSDHEVMDGDGSRITVYEKEQARTVGGSNSSHQAYNEIQSIIFKHVADEYEEWDENMQTYLIELNE